MWCRRVRRFFLPDEVSEEDKRRLLVSDWERRNYWGANWLSALSSLPLWPQHIHVHTVLHSCLCRAFTLTSSHFQTFPAPFPSFIFTLWFNAEVKEFKTSSRPQNKNGSPRLSPLSQVCCALRELNTAQETFIPHPFLTRPPSFLILLNCVSDSHSPTAFQFWKSKLTRLHSVLVSAEFGLTEVGCNFLTNLLLYAPTCMKIHPRCSSLGVSDVIRTVAGD